MSFEETHYRTVDSVVEVAVFGRHPVDGTLAVVLCGSPEQPMLPRVDGYAENLPAQVARIAMLANAKLPPIVQRTSTSLERGATPSSKPIHRAGHVAVATALRQKDILLADPDNLEGIGLSLSAQTIIADGLAWLRNPDTFSLRGRTTNATKASTRDILARLLPNPRAFTLPELAQACSMADPTYRPTLPLIKLAALSLGITAAHEPLDNPNNLSTQQWQLPIKRTNSPGRRARTGSTPS